MASFESILNKFKQVNEDLEKIGNDIVETYPNSKALHEMVEELGSAQTALQALYEQMSETVMIAEQDDGLKKEFLTKMDEMELYSSFSKEEKDQLAEFLVQNKQDLATEETLEAYVEEALSQKPSSDLLAMIPKANIIAKGKQLDDGSDGFDAYTVGYDAYKKAFDADKFQAVKELVKIWFEKGNEAVIREFYQKAFEVPKGEDSEEKE